MARFEAATGILCAVLLLAPSAMAQDAPPAAEAPPVPDQLPRLIVLELPCSTFFGLLDVALAERRGHHQLCRHL